MAATLPGTNELLAPSPAEAMEEAAAKKKRQEEGETLLRRTPPVKQESQMMPVACPTQPLNRLCDDLRKHFEQFGNAPKGADCVKALMNSYIHQHDDWRDYAFFHPSFYARNLVYADDHFELIVLCWKDGQMSPIHNHAGSSCWMGCLEGKIEETYYHIKEDNRKEEGICPNLEKGQVETHEKGEVAYIRDEIALQCNTTPLTASPPRSSSVVVTDSKLVDSVVGDVLARSLAEGRDVDEARLDGRRVDVQRHTVAPKWSNDMVAHWFRPRSNTPSPHSLPPLNRSTCLLRFRHTLIARTSGGGHSQKDPGGDEGDGIACAAVHSSLPPFVQKTKPHE